MSVEDLDFSETTHYDRGAVLFEAAARVDALMGHLGEDDQPASSEYGDLLRALVNDVAEFGAYPDVYPIPVSELPGADQLSSSRTTVLEQGYRFWWLEFPLTLFTRRNWAFNRLEVRLEFNPNEPEGYRRPKAYDILPNRQFETIAQVGSDINLRLGFDAHFALDTGPLLDAAFMGAAALTGASVQAGAGVEAGARAQTYYAFRPFQYRVAAARINHTAVGLERVFWRLDGAEFFQENVPRLIVIAQVPIETDVIKVRAILQAYRHFTLFPSGLQAAIRQLPEVLRAYFGGGAPLHAETPYDLSPRMRAVTENPP
jgi:hypothetical protein